MTRLSDDARLLAAVIRDALTLPRPADESGTAERDALQRQRLALVLGMLDYLTLTDPEPMSLVKHLRSRLTEFPITYTTATDGEESR